MSTPVTLFIETPLTNINNLLPLLIRFKLRWIGIKESSLYGSH